MAHAELALLIDHGWETLPTARRLLATLANGSTVSGVFADFGRKLFSLSRGFEFCGHAIPARLANGLAEAFTEIGEGNLVPSTQVIELLETAVNRWGDLLVELDATGELNIPEPTDTLIRLEATSSRRRTMQAAHSASAHSKPVDQAAVESGSLRYSEALVAASASLLDRIYRDNVSPYASSVSRIHHLATTLHEMLQHGPRSTLTEANAADSRVITLPCAPLTTTTAEVPDLPQVFLVDESPFFRMLLSSMLQTTELAIHAASSIGELTLVLNKATSRDVVIWGGAIKADATDQLSDFVESRDSASRPILFALVDQFDGDNSDETIAPEGALFERILVRTQFAELRDAILGHVRSDCVLRSSALLMNKCA